MHIFAKMYGLSDSCVHSGTNRVNSVIGPVPGTNDDYSTTNHSLVYSDLNRYSLPNHVV